MGFYKIVENGYIVLVGVNCGGVEITEQEYIEIMQVIHNKPEVPEGYDYRLTENLEWELFELPTFEEDEIASEADYQAALEDLGVNFNA